MKKLFAVFALCLALTATGCTSRTEFGPCIGAFDEKSPGLIYKVSDASYHQYGKDPKLPPESEAPCRWPQMDTKNFRRPGEQGSGIMVVGPTGIKGG